MLTRVFQFLVIVLAILAISVALIGWRKYSQLEAAIKRIRDSGDPVSNLDLGRKGIPPEENATTYLAMISQDAQKLIQEIEPAALSSDFSWKKGLNESQRDQVRKGLDAYPKVLEMIARASTCKYHAYPLDFSLPHAKLVGAGIESVQESRVYARILDCYGRYVASLGETNKAVEAYLQLMRLADHQGQEPLIISNLVSVACRGTGVAGLNGILQTSKLSQQAHEMIERELANQHTLGALDHSIKTERAFNITSMREQFPLYAMTWYGVDSLEYTGKLLALKTKTNPD